MDDEQHPIFVYRLADVPAPLRAHIADDSPLHRCAFYTAIAGPTTSAALDRAFEELPEPPLAAAEVEAGRQLARAIADALRAYAIDIVYFSTRSREEATVRRWGFHTGDAEPFCALLVAQGLTLLDGAQVFGPRIRFVSTDTPFVVRSSDGRTVSVTEPHVVRTGADGTLCAVMTAPAGFTHAWIGRDGGVIAEGAAGERVTFGAPRPHLLADDGELSPGWAAARCGDDEAGLARLVEQLAAGVHAIASGVRKAALARDWVRYLFSDRVTARMALVASAMLAALSAVLGEDTIAFHVDRALAGS